MSELKDFKSERIYWAVEQAERVAGDIDDLHLDDNLFYLKSEADEVIAEKDANIIQLTALIENYNRISREIIDNANHQKYKRCLAMAKWCFTKSNYHYILARHGEDAKENNRKSILYSRWRRRWFELAKKFKEAK